MSSAIRPLHLKRDGIIKVVNEKAYSRFGFKHNGEFYGPNNTRLPTGSDKQILNILNELQRTFDLVRSGSLTSDLLLDAQQKLADIEKDKSNSILNNEIGLWSSIKRGIARAISIVFIAAALLVVGELADKFDFVFPNIPIIRIGS